MVISFKLAKVSAPDAEKAAQAPYPAGRTEHQNSTARKELTAVSDTGRRTGRLRW